MQPNGSNGNQLSYDRIKQSENADNYLPHEQREWGYLMGADPKKSIRESSSL